MSVPITFVASGGVPVVASNSGVPSTPVADGGVPVVLVSSHGEPLTFVNDDLSSWMNPSQIAGLQAWYSAEDSESITLNGSDVSQWNDLSGNGNHAVQATEAQQPPYNATDSRAGGQPSVGAASNSGSVGMDIPSLTATHIFIVTAYEDGTDDTFDFFQCLLSGPGSFGDARIIGDSATDSLLDTLAFTGDVSINGAAYGATILPLPLSVCAFKNLSGVTQAFYLGFNQSTADRSWNGPICEVLFYNNASMTAAQEALITDYLANKWSIA